MVDADGSNLGVITTESALRRAQEVGLDLVEVNPKASPPVCKILDFGKYKYEEKKRASEAKKKQTVVEVKEVKIRPKTDDHDIDVKVRATRRFLESGNKVKVTCRFRGREIMHPQRAQMQFDIMVKRVEDVANIEQRPDHGGAHHGPAARAEAHRFPAPEQPPRSARARPRPRGEKPTDQPEEHEEELDEDEDDDEDDDDDDDDDARTEKAARAARAARTRRSEQRPRERGHDAASARAPLRRYETAIGEGKLPFRGAPWNALGDSPSAKRRPYVRQPLLAVLARRAHSWSLRHGLTPEGAIDLLGDTVVNIGRDPGSDLVLDDALTSRRHARIVVLHTGILLEDVGSKMACM